jgi:hypothetical protein
MTQQDRVNGEQSTIDLNSLLASLKDGAFFERKKAADDLGRLPQSGEQVIAALMQAAQTDSDPSVRRAAIQAMETPVHFQFIASQPKLARTLVDIKRNNEQESAVSHEVDDQGCGKTGLRFLTNIGQLMVGIIALFLLTPELPETYRWVCLVVVFVIGMMFIVQKYTSS